MLVIMSRTEEGEATEKKGEALGLAGDSEMDDTVGGEEAITSGSSKEQGRQKMRCSFVSITAATDWVSRG